MASPSSPSLLFFGSGPLALASLRFLAEHFSVEAVITKPAANHHHGPVPVLDYCQAHNLTVYTPANKQALSDLFGQQRFASPVGVVIDYGIIINQDVIDALPLGIVNSHFSLLPEWRGADPITFALLSGQAETGVSLMLINDKMDEGPLLAQAAVPIRRDHDGRSLTADLLEVSNQLLAEMLPLYLDNALQPVPQTSTIAQSHQPTYSRKLTKQDGVIDWQKPAEQLEREIRAFIDWPKSRADLGGIDVIITKAHVRSELAGRPGQLHLIDQQLVATTGAGSLVIDQLKPAGKADMTAAAFLAGYRQRLRLA